MGLWFEEKGAAMSISAGGPRIFSVGEAFSVTFNELLRRFGHYVGIVFIASVAGIVINLVAPIEPINAEEPSPEQMSAYFSQLAASFVLLIPVHGLITGALAYSVVAGLRGNDMSIGEALSAGLGVLLYTVAAQLVSGLIIGVGMLLLIVPGIIALLFLFVCTPVAAAESAWPVQAIRRSVFLTDGYRWQLLGIMLIQVVASFFLLAIIGSIASAFVGEGGATSGGAPSNSMPLMIVSALVTLPVNAFFSVLTIVVYYQLSVEKDQRDDNAVAQVFH